MVSKPVVGWPSTSGLHYLAPGVEGHVCSATNLNFIANSSIDFVLASNFAEHLLQSDFGIVLGQLRNKLVPGGRIALLQRNFRYAFSEHFDDYTHVATYSHLSLCDYLKAHAFEIVECHPRFLPLTIKSRPIVSPLLIWAYLRSKMLIMVRFGGSNKERAR